MKKQINVIKHFCMVFAFVLLGFCAKGEKVFAANTYLPYEDATYVLEYAVTDSGVEITGWNGEAKGRLVLPETIDGMAVTSIGESAFINSSGFEGELVIPNTVTTIEYSAFGACGGLSGKLKIPASVEVIGDTAFGYCNFDSLELSEGLKRIGSYAFVGCDDLRGDLLIPKSVEYLEDMAFGRCTGMSGHVYIGNPMLSMGMAIFMNFATDNTDIVTLHSAYEWDGYSDVSIYAYQNNHEFEEWDGKYVIDGSASGDGNGMACVDGQWGFYRDGQIDTNVNGLVEYDGAWFYLKQGLIDTSLLGFVEYDGALFYVAGGQIISDANGLVQDPVSLEWYFVSGGQAQLDYSIMASYDGSWFVLENGKLNQQYNGFYDYDGGTFLIAAGQLKSDYSGLFQHTDNNWYYIANGQIQTQYSGLALYDGVWFYVEKGMLNEAFTGRVLYNGSYFLVENGQVNMEATEEEAFMAQVKANCVAYENDMQEVLAFVNQYRAEVGAAPLVLDEGVCLAASIRAQEMVDNHYFSHKRPNGEGFYTVMFELGISGSAMGENIARGHETAAGVCNGWYHSSGHYANMVSHDYEKLGVGVADIGNGRKMWVQIFLQEY